jgi:soluble lytic murein transglycosylase
MSASLVARRGRSGVIQRRRRFGAVGAFLLIAAALIITLPKLEHAARELALPLSDASVIRQQAADKHLDPALIAAVIYAETKFDPRTSSAGAEGLMQILPSTAHFLAKLSGGVSFTTQDLATPSVNIAYGSYYLRYLLNHYEGNELLAIAAYNAGLANVDEWLAAAHAQGHQLTVGKIPFPQTKAYVQRVMQAQRAYRATYSNELGIG